MVFSAIVIIAVFTAGTALLMWLGEQINEKGIGNGISILLFAGIIARMPTTIGQLWLVPECSWQAIRQTTASIYFLVPLFVIIFLVVIWVIVFMNDSERRIPVQYAKRVVGRKMYGGQSSHIPIKVGMMRRSAHYLRKLDPVYPEHHRDLHGLQGAAGILERLF